MDRTVGLFHVLFDPFVPDTMLSIRTGATHFQFVAGGAEVDFNRGRYTVMTAPTRYLPVGNAAAAALTLKLPVTAGTMLPLFLVLGIEFQQEVNGQFLTLNNGVHNALALVRADVVG